MIELFFKHPLGAIGYGFLIVALLSIWVHRKLWVWGSFLAVSCAFAFYGNVIELQAFVPLILVGGCYFFAKQDISGFWRLFSCMAAAIITIAIYTHFIKGFNNILLFPEWRSGLDAIPMNIYANYDKGITALLILGIYLPVLRSKNELYRMLLATVPWMILTSIAILFLTQYLQIIKWDPKLPLISLTWLVLQLFFVIIPEEVFYRGFIQREIAKNLANPFAGIFAILTTSLLSALLHILFIPNLAFITVVFVTNILYGGIYQITHKIESSILTHFFVNTLHFFFFTYPMLS